jgi:Prenyltransferase and squalene oxidase repeat
MSHSKPLITEGRLPARLNRRAFLDRAGSAAAIAGAYGLSGFAGLRLRSVHAAEKEVLPKHVTPETLRAVIKGLDFLAGRQSEDGSWIIGGGEAYPTAMTGLAGTAFLAHGNSPTRGHYSKNVQGAVEYLVRCGTATGLITGPSQDSGMPMHGHGFALMFLACVYGMITKESLRNQVRTVIRKAVTLTSQGQSGQGGWSYVPGTSDEGSVTVTQVQALRAAHNAGFLVPKAVIEEAIKYLERCRTPEGGIEYSLRSGGGPRLPISAAAVATLYNAGQFDSTIATDCLKYVWDQFRANEGFEKGGGHAFYTHLYAAQGFYMAGDQYWDAYFPKTRDQLIAMQQPDGSWMGDGIGQVYGTAIATIILQLPYKYLPVFQR